MSLPVCNILVVILLLLCIVLYCKTSLSVKKENKINKTFGFSVPPQEFQRPILATTVKISDKAYCMSILYKMAKDNIFSWDWGGKRKAKTHSEPSN